MTLEKRRAWSSLRGCWEVGAVGFARLICLGLGGVEGSDGRRVGAVWSLGAFSVVQDIVSNLDI